MGSCRYEIKKNTFQTMNALFLSMNRTSYCTFFSTASTESFFEKILDFTILFIKIICSS